MTDSMQDQHEVSVPTELLELHIELEIAGVTAEEFAEAYGETSN